MTPQVKIRKMKRERFDGSRTVAAKRRSMQLRAARRSA